MNFVWECLWKTSLTTLLVWAIAELLRRRSAALRHALWLGGLAAFLVLPGLLPLARQAPVVIFTAHLPPALDVVTIQPSHVSPPRPTLPWRQLALALWIAGTLVIAIRRSRAAWRMRGIAARSKQAPGFSGDVRLSSEVRAPLTWGLLRPVILLPQHALAWTSECLESVLAHEREHIRRFDCLSHWLAELVCATWWFHPLAWVARNRAAHERECACDDAVLRGGIRPSDYASELLHLASTMPRQGEPVMALSALSDFERRIRTMLLADVDRRPAGRRTAMAVATAAALVILPLAMLQAQAPAGQGDLSGTVIDPSGGRVANAQIIASGSAGNREVTRTDAAGDWTLVGVPAGTYTVEVQAHGFKVGSRHAVLAAGQQTKVDLPLALGSVSETVEVVSQGQPRRPVVATPSTPERIRVGGNVQATKLVKRVNPRYPGSAKAQGIEGTVLLNAIIGKEGNLLSLSVMNKLADPDLAAAALQAVEQWRYEPTLLNGMPVEIVTTITINFRLEM